MDKLFELYLKELIEWNQRFNLTAVTKPEDIRKKHFEDSLLLLSALPLNRESVLDVGAGAGFPGIPLKIACPEIKLTLLESTSKKVEFLKHIIKVLGLNNTEAVWERAEEFVHKNREKFDLVVARAVAKLDLLCEFCLPLVKVGGKFVAYKQVGVEGEVSGAKNAITVLGGSLKEIKKFPARSLVIVNKVKITPRLYPRPAGIAKRKPL